MDPNKIRVGQRVRPSLRGIDANLFPGDKAERSGVIVKIDRSGFPKVLWDGLKTLLVYHPNFIDVDRRRKRQ